jgi:hypothetical protein
VLLLHGTTRQRAESIIIVGPDASFREPGGSTADGFSTCLAEGPFDFGSPELYARRKAAIFPNEGGPAILAFEVPEDIADTMIGAVGQLIPGKAFNAGAEIRFEAGGGLEHLLAVWAQLSRTVNII